MRSRRYFIPLAVLALVVGFVVYFYSTKNSRAISYHRQQYLAISQHYHEYLTTITNEAQMSALVQTMNQQRDALLKLGYLEQSEIPL
jgi:uncharacterized protein YdbL (DUF1318 family)